ncbi:uncharacterized protein LOC123545573 [Mercenaria mercenaria]|uniref:uncharacterized protein LOC123545573 n=1 Tax=Mercenaria mercenaria TaxID=6596 RepID=UPI00234EF181|nr:uncharacterized protein LOC123545573 [Mercenaria mercenaria]
MVDELLNLLEENTENYPDNASQEKNIMPSVMRGAAYILRNMQISSQLLLTKSLKTSFADIRSDINRCLEQFGKDVSIIDVNRQKDIPENLQKRNVEGQMKYLKQTVTEQEKEIKEIQRQNRILQNEIEQYRPENVSATVQLLNTLGGNSVDEMEKELKTTLTSKLGTMNFITCQSASDLDDKKLVIVLCIVSTRLRADAAKAIKDIKNPGNAALLIIHITEAHYLPNQNSSSNLTDQNFKKLRHIFDMAFKSGNGFFQCDMNERSINELCSFCKKHPYGDRF